MTIVEQDIFDYKPSAQFDCMLFLWASICSFTDQEIVALLNQLKNKLINSGYIIIDIPIANSNQFANVTAEKGFFTANLNGVQTYCNIPSLSKLKQLASKAQLRTESVMPYIAKSKRTRHLVIISKAE